MSPLVWAAALVVTFVAATVQGVVGLGFALISVPILALINPALAPVPQLLITLPLTLTMAWRERAHLELKGVGWVIAGRFPGAAIGVFLLGVATQQALDIWIAVLVLVSVVIVASGVHLRRNPMTEFGAGTFAGMSGLVASIGGPPLALLYSRDEGPVIRSNLAAIFAFGMTVSITARALTDNMSWSDVRVAAVLLPAMAAGYLVSLRIKDRANQALLRKLILVLSVLGALGLLVRALF